MRSSVMAAVFSGVLAGVAVLSGAAVTPAPEAGQLADPRTVKPAPLALARSPMPRQPTVLSNEEWLNSLRSEKSWAQRRSNLGAPWGSEDPKLQTAPLLSGTFRTVCVRLCDGFFFPISFATTRDHFGADEATCQSRCPSGARLFVHRNPGQDAEDMVDLNGQSYGKLRTAFLYRTSYDASCKCKPHPWEQEARLQHRVYALQAERRKGSRVAVAELKAIEVSTAAAAAQAQANARSQARRRQARHELTVPSTEPPVRIAPATPPVALPPNLGGVDTRKERAGRATRTAEKGKALPSAMQLGAGTNARRGEEWRRKAFPGN